MAYTKIDQELLERCLDSDQEAWKDFVDRYLGLFIHVIRHTAQCRDIPLQAPDIDDLCAVILETLISKRYAVLKRFRGESSLGNYLVVVARRIVVNEMRQLRKEGRLGASGDSSMEMPVFNPGVSGEQERYADCDEVRHLLAQMSPRDAEVVRQYHLEGRNYKEIAKRLGLPVNTIGSILSRVKQRFQQKQPSRA